MSDFGLTPQGFLLKRLPEIKTSLETAFREQLGDDIDLASDTVAGQLVGLFSKQYADVWEGLGSIYAAQYPNSADGKSLDDILALVGLTRLPATKTSISAACFGDVDTIIPSGSRLRSRVNENEFVSTSDVTISADCACEVTINVLEIKEDFDYSITLNQSEFIINSGDEPDEEKILTALAEVINESDCSVHAILEDKLIIRYDSTLQAFSIQVSDELSIDNLASPGEFFAEVPGQISALENTIDNIVTPVVGWRSANNTYPGTIGRNIENDTDFRLRHQSFMNGLGNATLTAIRSKVLQEVPGVTKTRIYENREPIPDEEGRPSHSIELIAVGGSDKSIAEKLFEVKAAGIETFGNKQELIEDSNGDVQSINFSRPESLFIWVKCELIVAPNFPDGGADSVADGILEAANIFDIGDDVLIQALLCGVYTVPGITQSKLLLAVSHDNTPPDEWVEDNIPVGVREIALFDKTRISVTCQQ